MKQANLALVAEPIIAALNIGGGIAGLGFPAGDAARLPYNLITWKLTSSVPSVKQMRELFAVMAARERNPQMKVKPERYLSRQDIRVLQEAGRQRRRPPRAANDSQLNCLPVDYGPDAEKHAHGQRSHYAEYANQKSDGGRRLEPEPLTERGEFSQTRDFEGARNANAQIGTAYATRMTVE